jgi:hypothetical protein
MKPSNYMHVNCFVSDNPARSQRCPGEQLEQAQNDWFGLQYVAGMKLKISFLKKRIKGGLPAFKEPELHTLKLRGGGSSISAYISRAASTSSSTDEIVSSGDEDCEADDSNDADELQEQRLKAKLEDENSSAQTQSDSNSCGSSSSSSSSSISSTGCEREEVEVDYAEDSEEEMLHIAPRQTLGKFTIHTSCTGDLRNVLAMLSASRRIIVVTGAGLSA